MLVTATLVTAATTRTTTATAAALPIGSYLMVRVPSLAPQVELQ